MTSNKPNRPPGITSHNVEVNFDRFDNVGGLTETTEIPLTMSDLIASHTTAVLEQMQPYPFNESPIEDSRFLVYQFEEDRYVIMDQEL